KNDAKAAYAIIHDDVCDKNIGGLVDKASPELVKRGLRAGFGVIAGFCDTQNKWSDVNALASAGQDVFNHSLHHCCLDPGNKECDPNAPCATTDYATEIGMADTELKAHGVTSSFFIFPYDAWNGDALNYLRSLGYVGARAGDRGQNDANF